MPKKSWKVSGVYDIFCLLNTLWTHPVSPIKQEVFQVAPSHGNTYSLYPKNLQVFASQVCGHLLSNKNLQALNIDLDFQPVQMAQVFTLYYRSRLPQPSDSTKKPEVVSICKLLDPFNWPLTLLRRDLMSTCCYF